MDYMFNFASFDFGPLILEIKDFFGILIAANLRNQSNV